MSKTTVRPKGDSVLAQKQWADLLRSSIDDYHAILRDTPGLLEKTRIELTEQMNAVNITFGGRVFMPYLRPHFVPRAQWDRIGLICSTLWAGVLKVGERALVDPTFQDYLGLTEIERELVATDPKYGGISKLSRLDSFLTGDSYSFVELNAETPAGVAYSDVGSEIFSGLEVMKRFTQKYKLSQLNGRKHLLESLLSAYAEYSGSNKKPQIAIVDYKGLATQREFELVQEYLEKHGLKAIIADPRELTYSGGRLRHGDFEIDLIYKRLLVNELLEKADECKDLLAAYKDQAVCMVNSFRGKLVHKKLLFAALTDERYAEMFTAEERELAQRHVPWTRRMEDRKTEFYGDKIDLLNFVKDNRDNLVLKPNDDYGGKGIFIGWNSTAQEWDTAMQSALGGDYLVQERVSTSREVFPYVDEQGKVEFCEQLVDLDPLLFDGKAGSAFTRLSNTELANVTAGGGMVPVFIIEGK